MKTAASTFVSKLVRVTGLVLCLAAAVTAPAQQASEPSANLTDANKQLLDRINDLETKVKQLEEKQNAAAPVAVPAPEPAVTVQPRRLNEVSERLKFRVFGDVGYEASDRKPSTNTFEIGSLDLFMTSRLTEKVSALAEILFIPGNDNSIAPDIERMLLQYHHNDYLTVGIGRYHTSIGYYNTAFHQGEWFQTAIGRPFMYAFDDQGLFASAGSRCDRQRPDSFRETRAQLWKWGTDGHVCSAPSQPRTRRTRITEKRSILLYSPVRVGFPVCRQDFPSITTI